MKRTLAIGFCTLLCAVSTALANPQRMPPKEQELFPDVSAGHWCRPAIEALARAQVVQGDSKGRFNGNAPVTRRDFDLILDRYNSRRSAPLPTPQWAEEQKTYLTRFEFAVALSRLEHFFFPRNSSNVNPDEENVKIPIASTQATSPQPPREQIQNFPDVPPTHWAYSATNYVANHGIMEGDLSGRFHGDVLLTRYELAVAIVRSEPSYY